MTYLIYRKKRRVKKDESGHIHRLGRHIRSAMNDDDEETRIMEDNIPINQTSLIPNEDASEDTKSPNDTVESIHTLNKRLDPSIDPNNGQIYEEGNELRNQESTDYRSDTANYSLLDHQQIINLLRQQSREGKNNGHLPRVKIHNIISGLPKPEIEMLYAVYQGINHNSKTCIFHRQIKSNA